MRIAYVCADPGVPAFGRKGASAHVQAVLGALVRAGHEVVLLATRTGGPPPAALADVGVVQLPPLPRGDAATRERAAIAADAEHGRRLESHGPFDLVLERHSLFSRAPMAYAARVGVPGVLEVNSPLVEEQARHRDLAHPTTARAAVAAAMRDATVVACVSDGVATWARTVAGPAADRVVVEPNGVDVPRSSARPLARAADDPFVVAFVGTLKPWHGVDVLAAAFAALAAEDDVSRLLVVGDGPLRPALEDDLRARGVRDRATLTGSVAPHAVAAHLADANVGVAPYPPGEHYFSPLKILDYQAAGLPVVASRGGQVDELLAGGRYGVLVEGGDPAALAGALGALRDAPEAARRLGALGRGAVGRGRTWDAVVERILGHAGAHAGGARGRRSLTTSGRG